MRRWFLLRFFRAHRVQHILLKSTRSKLSWTCSQNNTFSMNITQICSLNSSQLWKELTSAYLFTAGQKIMLSHPRWAQTQSTELGDTRCPGHFITASIPKERGRQTIQSPNSTANRKCSLQALNTSVAKETAGKFSVEETTGVYSVKSLTTMGHWQSPVSHDTNKQVHILVEPSGDTFQISWPSLSEKGKCTKCSVPNILTFTWI